MAYGKGSRIVASAERKFGHLAIPNLLHWVAGFQFLVFVLSAIDPNYMSLISFNRDAIFSGQVWRLFSYVFFPQTNSMFWILISVFFMWFISNGLESAWGSFRVNLYILATMFCLTSIGLILPGLAGNGSLLSVLVFCNVFFAFASHYPNQQILLMMIIPVKIKYIAWMYAVYLLLIFLGAPLIALLILPGLLPYLAIFTPGYIRDIKNSSKAASRRAKFSSDAGDSDSEPFHTCIICETNDVTEPDLEFRVIENGDEYCLPCLEKMKQKDSAESESS